MKRYILTTLLGLATWLSPAVAQDDHNFEVTKSMEIFNEVYRYLDLIYVDSLQPQQTVNTAINAMLRSLDPYTVYYPDEKVSDFKTMVTGRYVGIGSVIRHNLKLNRVMIEEPYAGTPAAEAGLRRGDVILSIDDEDMTQQDVSYISSQLRGDAGTTFALKVWRPVDDDTLTMRITRRAVTMPAIPYYSMLDNGVAYINLNSFTDDCYKEMRRAYIDLKAQAGGSLNGLVLDLRGNGGGSLSEAVSIVNMFVPRGLTVVRKVGKMQRSNSEYKTTTEPLDTTTPIVILVNSETASAAEITSGALQDFQRATLVGTATYGKGLVQVPVNISYNGQLKVTESKYYLPSGRCPTRGVGIQPDIVVELDSLPNIAYYLTINGLDSTEVMHEWETRYIATHPTIAPPQDFALSDEDYEDFKAAVVASGFTYDPESGNALKTLKEIIRFEGYYDDAQEEIEALERKLSHNISRDLDRHKTIISQIIENDLATSYYFQAGTVANALRYDKQLKRALQELSALSR